MINITFVSSSPLNIISLALLLLHILFCPYLFINCFCLCFCLCSIQIHSECFENWDHLGIISISSHIQEHSFNSEYC